MRKKLLVGLALLNVLLAVFVFSSRAQALLLPYAMTDCCKNEGTPSGYCCADCCWFTADCTGDEDCQG